MASSSSTASSTNHSTQMHIPGASDPAVMEAIEQRGNCVVFLDIAAANSPLGRIKLELFSRDCPKTAENFRALCTGERFVNENPVGYKGSTFHRVMQGFMIQGGEVKHRNLPTFPDENYLHNHDTPGMLSSANSGPNTNCTQFFITTGQADFLNGKHCVFGKVLDAASMLTVRKIENTPVGVSGTSPQLEILIVESGEL